MLLEYHKTNPRIPWIHLLEEEIRYSASHFVMSIGIPAYELIQSTITSALH